MINIGGRMVGIGNKPFVIAEMSGDHNQSLERALEIVEAAVKTGMHAINCRPAPPILMTFAVSEGEFIISNEQSFWKGISLHGSYKRAHTLREAHKPILQ